MEEQKIPKRVTTALIKALNGGVAPSIGTEYISVGRINEAKALIGDLEAAKNGNSSFRFIMGSNGSGKTFLLNAIRNKALEPELGFVVMKVDLNPQTKLWGSQNEGLMTYRELMVSMAVKTRPNGGALELIIQKWLAQLKKQVSKGEVLDLSDPLIKEDIYSAVKAEIRRTISQMKSMVFDSDFVRVMSLYWEGEIWENDELKQNALKWFRGEYAGKLEAKQDLRVSSVIDGRNWFSFIKLWAEFVTLIGYSGILVSFDEAATLSRSTSPKARNDNYDCILSMYNDSLQGNISNIVILMGVTEEFVQDNRRGLFSSTALKSRLEESPYTDRDGKRNWDSPIIPLKPLQHYEIITLMRTLREIHGIHYNYDPVPRLTDNDLDAVLNKTIQKVGMSSHFTVREAVKNTMHLLGLLHDNPDMRCDEILLEKNIKAPEDEEEDFLRDEE